MKWSFYLINVLKIFFSNFLPRKIVTCDDRNPPWNKNNIKQPIQEKNDTHRSYILNHENPQIFHKVKYLQKQLKNLIEHSQKKILLTYIKKIDRFNDKSKNLPINIKNIVKQQQNSLYSSFTSEQQICNRF